MRRRSRQFVAFYIHRLEFFSRLGLFPIQWSESRNKFTSGPPRDVILNAIFTLSIIVEVIYTTTRSGVYLFLTPVNRQELNEFVLLITWTIIAHGSWFGITTLWKGGGLVRCTATTVVKNIAKLQALTGIMEKTDPIRARLVHYWHWYWALFLVYMFGILELYRLDPKNPIFLYSITNFNQIVPNCIAWLPFLALNLLNTGFYIGMLSFFGHYLRICSTSIVNGTELLSPTMSSRPCKFSQAMSWYRHYTIMMLMLNESIGPSLLMSTILHLTGLSLASFTIIRLHNELSVISYCLYYVIFVQIILYTIAAYQTMGMIPAATALFLVKWKRFARSKREIRILNSMRSQGMDFSGLFIYKRSQMMHFANIGANLIIFFLTLDQ